MVKVLVYQEHMPPIEFDFPDMETARPFVTQLMPRGNANHDLQKEEGGEIVIYSFSERDLIRVKTVFSEDLDENGLDERTKGLLDWVEKNAAGS